MQDSEFKACPFCKEQIRKDAVKCRFCGEWLERPAPSKLEQPDKIQSIVGSAHPKKTEPIQQAAAKTANATLPRVENKIEGKKHWPIIPLSFFFFIVFWAALPKALELGVSNKMAILRNTSVYCTTPVNILLLLIFGIWFSKSYAAYLSSRRPVTDEGGKAFDYKYAGVSLAVILVLGAFAYSACSTAWEKGARKNNQMLRAQGVNADAFKDWEITKKKMVVGDGNTGLTPEAKQRMRESLALQYKGEFASVPGMTVALDGEKHDRMVFAVNVEMNLERITVFTNVLNQTDPDFWNRLRYLNFVELDLVGTNYSKIFQRSDFETLGQNYEGFVSNTIAMYDTTGDSTSFFLSKNEISPEMQKTMRIRLAAAFNGSFSSLYKTFVVKLMGTNDDVLLFSCMDLDAKGMTGILKEFQDAEDGNFFNGLTAMGFSEFNLEANNYRRSIPRSEFIRWCRNYENYMSEMRKVVGQMSDAMKHDRGKP